MTDITTDGRRAAGLEAIGRMMSPEVARAIESGAGKVGFAPEMGEFAVRNVFGDIWSRPSLDWRTRSVVTVSILIALRAHDELRIHAGIALKNGLTVTELEEIVYHAAAYAGFPAGNSARTIIAEVIAERTA